MIGNALQITGHTDTREVFIGGVMLSPVPSQKLKNHSPDGFAWGYGGSGPAQLALAILLALTGDKDFALANYQDFKFTVVAELPIDKDFSLPIGTVDEWIKIRRDKEKNGEVKSAWR
jgi:hypothetical protein